MLTIARPLASQRVEPRVSGLMLRALADIAMRNGVTPEQLFHEQVDDVFSMDPLDLRVPLREYGALLERAARLTGLPGLGLLYGFQSNESAFYMFAPLMSHGPSLRHALGEGQRFQELVIEGARLELSEQSGVAKLQWRAPSCGPVGDRILAEFVVAGLCRMLRSYGSTTEELLAVSFEHSRPDYADQYAEAFSGVERFDQPVTSLEFAARRLDVPHIHSYPALQRVIHLQAEQCLQRVVGTVGVAGRLLGYLRNQPPGNIPAMEQAARDLGVSARTLRRRLGEEGLSYRALSQEILRDWAQEMLGDRDRTLKDIASCLGFCDVNAFHRAFKRWTSVTPTQFREQNVAASAGATFRAAD